MKGKSGRGAAQEQLTKKAFRPFLSAAGAGSGFHPNLRLTKHYEVMSFMSSISIAGFMGFEFRSQVQQEPSTIYSPTSFHQNQGEYSLQIGYNGAYSNNYLWREK